MTSWLPSLNALRAFEAVARHRSYRKAADELSVTPAALKQLVKKLEDAIGEPLLLFNGHDMELSSTGALSHADLSNAFRQISFAVHRMRRHADNDRLVVSAEPSIASAWLVPRLQRFTARNPDIEILVHSSMQVADLSSGLVDVGIRFGVSGPADLVVERLFDERLSALCSPGLAAGPPKIERLEQLQDVPLLRWDLSECEWATNTLNWNFWQTWLRAVGADHVTPGRGIKYSDYNQAVQAALAGHGFILGSKPILSDLTDAGMLVDPFGISAHPGIGYDAVTTPSALQRPKVGKFLSWILEEARAGAH